MPLFAPAPQPKRVISEARRTIALPRWPLRRSLSPSPPRISSPVPRPQPLPEPPPQLCPRVETAARVRRGCRYRASPEGPAGTACHHRCFHRRQFPAGFMGTSSKPPVQTGTFSAGNGTANRPEAASSRLQMGGFDASRTAANQPQNAPPPVAAAGFGGPGVESRSSAAARAPAVGAFGESVAVRTAGPRGLAPSAAGFGSLVATVSAAPQATRDGKNSVRKRRGQPGAGFPYRARRGGGAL